MNDNDQRTAQVAPCAFCGKVRTPDEIHISTSSNPGKCVVLSANAECPAWADGKHCFQVIYHNCEGFTSLTPQPTTKFSGVHGKRCACGAEVKRAT